MMRRWNYYGRSSEHNAKIHFTRRGLPPAVMSLAMNQPMDRVRMELTRNIRRE